MSIVYNPDFVCDNRRKVEPLHKHPPSHRPLEVVLTITSRLTISGSRFAAAAVPEICRPEAVLQLCLSPNCFCYGHFSQSPYSLHCRPQRRQTCVMDVGCSLKPRSSRAQVVFGQGARVVSLQTGIEEHASSRQHESYVHRVLQNGFMILDPANARDTMGF